MTVITAPTQVAKPHNILYVIEDIATSSCKRMLEEQGYAVACVTDAELIYAMSKQRRIDLVLIDVAVRRPLDDTALKVRRTHPRVPIVLLSSQDFILEGTYAWADGFATNSSCQSVLETVNTVLQAEASAAKHEAWPSDRVAHENLALRN